MTDKLDPEAHRLLRAMTRALQDALDPLLRAHRHATGIIAKNGPDFRPKITTLNESVEALIENINAVSPEAGPHEERVNYGGCSDPKCPAHGTSIYIDKPRAADLACTEGLPDRAITTTDTHE